MKEKHLESKNTVQDWIQAYEEKIQEITKFNSYTTSKKSHSIFERLMNAYPEANPFDFMEAVTEPTVWWGVPKKRGGGWKKLQYPFPTMLLGKKAENIYKKYMKCRKPTRKSREEEILQSVFLSFERISKLKIDLSNLEEVYYLTVNETISPYLFLSIKDSIEWYVLECNRGNLDSRWLDDFLRKNRLLNSIDGLREKIRVILYE